MSYCPESVGEAPYAVFALIINGDKILSVSRKNNHADFGLPGGKLDPGEGFKEALIREVMEETGLLVTAMEPVYGAYCGTEGIHKVHWTMTYLCRVSGEINTKEAAFPGGLIRTRSSQTREFLAPLPSTTLGCSSP